MDHRERTILGALGFYLLGVVVVVAIAFAAAGCAAKQYHAATVAIVSADAFAGLVQDEADASICGKPTALPAPACLTQAQRGALSPYLKEALTLIIQGGETIKTMGPNATLWTVVAANADRIKTLLQQAFNLLPKAAQAHVTALAAAGGK